MEAMKTSHNMSQDNPRVRIRRYHDNRGGLTNPLFLRHLSLSPIRVRRLKESCSALSQHAMRCLHDFFADSKFNCLPKSVSPLLIAILFSHFNFPILLVIFKFYLQPKNPQIEGFASCIFHSRIEKKSDSYGTFHFLIFFLFQ